MQVICRKLCQPFKLKRAEHDNVVEKSIYSSQQRKVQRHRFSIVTVDYMSDDVMYFMSLIGITVLSVFSYSSLILKLVNQIASSLDPYIHNSYHTDKIVL
jgi:hypothetical protein